MNADYCKKALEKVENPNVLVNLISKRVRQLSSGGGTGRPLISETVGMGTGDIALVELIENKMGWEMPDVTAALEPTTKKRRRA